MSQIMEWQKYPNKKGKILWTADGRTIPKIEPHTKIKHLLVESYLEDWVKTIIGKCKFGAGQITIIDGFCGGGVYKDSDHSSWEGSPLRIIRAVESSWREVQEQKPYQNLDIAYRFIDARKEHTQCLELQIREAGFGEILDSGRCEIITQKFEDYLEPCLNWLKVRKGYSFFFLDPFGLVDLPAMSAAILKLGKSEVLLNHMQHDGIIRPVGWHREWGDVDKFLAERNLANHYKWMENFDALPVLTQQSLLHDSALKIFRDLSKPRFAWTFAFMKDIAVYYYLIHLSNNPTAVSVMRKVLWKYNNLEYQYHYGTFGMGYRTVEALNKNLKTIDIHETNVQECQNHLRESLDRLLHETSDQLPFQQIFERTIEQNPATKEYYMDVIHQMNLDGDLEIIRDDNTHKKARLINRDLIKKRRIKQIPLFTVSQFSTAKKPNSNRFPSQVITTKGPLSYSQPMFPGFDLET
jgi:three-Cys-motif partner protein